MLNPRGLASVPVVQWSFDSWAELASIEVHLSFHWGAEADEAEALAALKLRVRVRTPRIVDGGSNFHLDRRVNSYLA